MTVVFTEDILKIMSFDEWMTPLEITRKYFNGDTSDEHNKNQKIHNKLMNLRRSKEVIRDTPGKKGVKYKRIK